MIQKTFKRMFQSLGRPGRPASRIHVLNYFDTKAVVHLFFFSSTELLV